MTEVVLFGDIVEENGKTIRENNMAKKHALELGSVVEVDVSYYHPQEERGVEVNLKGTCRLIVVGHNRDCDGTPLYAVADIPVPKPKKAFTQEWMQFKAFSHLSLHGYPEEALKPTGNVVEMYDSVGEWLGV